MAELPTSAREVRKRVMDQMLREGTVPTVDALCRELGLSSTKLSNDLKDLEAAVCLALQDSAHAGRKEFQDEPVQEALPEFGEIIFARPFATFRNHYPVWVGEQQKWFAECAVEACSISAQFPGTEVIVRSICRQTKQPVELVGRDGELQHYSPTTLRVHLGYPVRTIPSHIVGWCDYNSFFASEDTARDWQKDHPEIKGITRSPQEMARLVAEIIGKGRLEYSYQPPLPILKVLRNINRYGLTMPTRIGIRVPDPFWIPTVGMLREWRQQGLGNFFRFSLR